MHEFIQLETVDQCVQNRRMECTHPVWQVIPYLCGMDKICQERGRPALERAKVMMNWEYLNLLSSANQKLIVHTYFSTVTLKKRFLSISPQVGLEISKNTTWMLEDKNNQLVEKT